MMKKQYEAPEVELLEVNVEAGIALTGSRDDEYPGGWNNEEVL